MRSMTRRLRIQTTWDGEAAEPSEVAEIRLETGAGGGGPGVLVDAPFHGDPPPPGSPGSTPDLWHHEVVELFVAEATDDASAVRYLEVELSPHGHYLVLRFEGVRRPVEEGLPLEYEARIDRAAARWTGEARIPPEWLPPGPLRVNACAMHGTGDDRRYLTSAPLPPGDAPDFHQPLSFPVLLGW